MRSWTPTSIGFTERHKLNASICAFTVSVNTAGKGLYWRFVCETATRTQFFAQKTDSLSNQIRQ